MYMYGNEMYIDVMTTYSVARARQHLSDVLDSAQTQAVTIERRGVPAAVVVSPEVYERMLAALEEAEDVAAFDAAMDEPGDNIPWEQVRSDLGWA